MSKANERGLHAERGSRWLKSVVVVLAVIAVVVSFVAGRMSVMGPVGEADGDAAERDEDEPQLYQSPMHPQHTSTDPDATCPECGMDMVPADEVDAPLPGEMPMVSLGEREMALLGVQTHPVERRDVSRAIGFAGRLDYDRTRVREVVVRAAGYVERLHTDYRGRAVAGGEPLAELDSPAVQAAARELLTIADGDGQRGLDAARARLRRLGLSDEQIDSIIESGQVPERFDLLSPMDGVVVELGGYEGQWLAEGASLMRLADLSRLWVELDVYERQIAAMREGQSVELRSASYPGQTFAGEIAFVEPEVDRARRTGRVRVEVENAQGRLMPGMFVRGRVQVEGVGTRELATAGDGADERAEVERPLVIPGSAALVSGERAVVYVRDGHADEPTFIPRVVELGERAGDWYVVRGGLAEGEQVVSRGAFMLDSELQIRGQASMMMPEGLEELNGHDDDRAHEHEHAEADDVQMEAVEVPGAFAEQAGELVQAYFALSEAMADDDLALSVERVQVLGDRLAGMEVELLDEAGREAWRELDATLDAAIAGMAEAEDLAGQRDHLAALSEATRTVVERFAREAAGPVYLMYCPMAEDDEGGYWLSPSDEVVNPYMGHAMLACGWKELTIVDP